MDVLLSYPSPQSKRLWRVVTLHAYLSLEAVISHNPLSKPLLRRPGLSHSSITGGCTGISPVAKIISPTGCFECLWHSAVLRRVDHAWIVQNPLAFVLHGIVASQVHGMEPCLLYIRVSVSFELDWQRWMQREFSGWHTFRFGNVLMFLLEWGPLLEIACLHAIMQWLQARALPLIQ